MPLAGFQPETRKVSTGGGNSFDVKGLSLNEIAVLIREHFPDLDAIVDLFQGVNLKDDDQLRPLLLSVVSQAPGFAANVIALAAGEGSASDAEKLPGPVQVKALLDIGELTFADVGGVGKAWEMIAGLLSKTGLTKKLSQATTKNLG